MHFEYSIEIDASQGRVWEILTDVEAWPERIETVESVELLTPPPLSRGSQVRLTQPRVPEGVWDITIWEPPSYFEWHQESTGANTVAGHRVENLSDHRSRLTLTLEMRGLLVPIFGRMYKDLTNRYMTLEAQAIKTVAESSG